MRTATTSAILISVALPVLGQTSPPVQGEMLSAFFGLDRSLRIAVATRAVCGGNLGTDGMPVIFSHEVDATTLDPADFRVTTASGQVGEVNCVTLRPADEPGELRTALLVGSFGSVEDQPAQIEVIGDITSLDGMVSFQGATTAVIPLEAGPTLVLAEPVVQQNWTLGGQDDCPADGLVTMVRATWAGGVTRPGGDEIGPEEVQMYRVTLRQADGTTVPVAPMAIGDLNDNDNNHELCLGVAGTPVSVFFPARALTDPNEDLNPDTEVAVSTRPEN
jgi:hypothetical protein